MTDAGTGPARWVAPGSTITIETSADIPEQIAEMVVYQDFDTIGEIDRQPFNYEIEMRRRVILL